MSSSDDFYGMMSRRLLLATLFCALMAAAAVEAMYRLPCLAEMRLAWRADAGRFPFTLLCWGGRSFGGNLLRLRLPELAAMAVVLAGVLWAMQRCSLRLLLCATAAVLILEGVGMVHEVKGMRAQRHALFELRDGVERMLAPGETLVVEDERLAWLLDWYGSPEEKAALTVPDTSVEAVWEAKSFAGVSPDGEAVLVGGRSQFAGERRTAGLSLQPGEVVPAATQAELSRMFGEDVGVYFVTRSGADVSSKP
jgi:hypothetical protein